MEIQKGPTGEGAGKKRGEGPSDVQPPGEETFSEDEEEDEEDNYCPLCGRTGGCTCGNTELYSGHPWVFD